MSKIAIQNLTHRQRVKMLYKTVLRLHKGLPDELKTLGDGYTREEFKRHKQCTQKEAELFLSEWAEYGSTLAKQLGLKGKQCEKIGKDLDEETIQKLSDGQLIQLYELMKAAKGEENTSETM